MTIWLEQGPTHLSTHILARQTRGLRTAGKATAEGHGELSCLCAVVEERAIGPQGLGRKKTQPRGRLAPKSVQRTGPNGARHFLHQVFRRRLPYSTKNLVDVVHHEKEHRTGREENSHYRKPDGTGSAAHQLIGDEGAGALRFSEEFIGDGTTLFHACAKHQLEGIVSKLATSRYRSGRSRSWLKTKCFMESELTLIGIDRDRRQVPRAHYFPGLIARNGSMPARHFSL